MAFRLMTVLVIMVLSIALSPFMAFSQDTFGPACGRATIDGRVDPGEWSAASSKTFQMTNSANSHPGSHPARHEQQKLPLPGHHHR